VSTEIIAAEQAIYARFKTEWETTHARSEPFHLEGEPQPRNAAAYAMVIIHYLTSTPRSMGELGQAKLKRPGLIQVQCFQRSGSGRTLSNTLAKVARDIFERQSFSDVHCETGTIRRLRDDGSYIGAMAEIEFSYDEAK